MNGTTTNTGKMKIEEITIDNFRGFAQAETIKFDQLNAFIGKNDAGKSTILEALDIFFNGSDASVKIDKEDRNKNRLNENISITVSFSGFPSRIIIDANNETSLKAEHLLNNKKFLEIKKEYSGPKPSVYIVADHPICEEFKDLLTWKQSALQKAVAKHKWDCEDERKNASLRKCIWENCKDFINQKTEIPTDKISANKDEARDFWDKIEKHLPHYALFQSDRKNQESDDEVQTPLKGVVKEIVEGENLKQQLDDIAEKVTKQIESVVKNTLKKLQEMNPEIAETLKPNMPAIKWPDMFKNIGITSDNDIPLNKRGSGVRRLILLSFFRAEAERKQAEKKKNNVIYALEEPETSQHIEHQKMLVDAFIELSDNSQVLITTHSPSIVQQLAKKEFNPNLVKKENGKISITSGTDLFNPKQLALHPIKSGNEISFLAFGYISSEFHTELYSYLESERKDIFDSKIGWEKEKEQEVDDFVRKYKNIKTGKEFYTSFHKYIRHQIHHPENEVNPPYTEEDLRKSIDMMRQYLFDSPIPPSKD